MNVDKLSHSQLVKGLEVCIEKVQVHDPICNVRSSNASATSCQCLLIAVQCATITQPLPGEVRIKEHEEEKRFAKTFYVVKAYLKPYVFETMRRVLVPHARLLKSGETASASKPNKYYTPGVCSSTSDH
jgi:hypothetical protein